jgi:hypothetical protein
MLVLLSEGYEFDLHELLGNNMEVYIDDIVIKPTEFSSHIADLRKAFDKMRRYGLKMNPRKCAFGVSAGKFLGFIIHDEREMGLTIFYNRFWWLTCITNHMD